MITKGANIAKEKLHEQLEKQLQDLEYSARSDVEKYLTELEHSKLHLEKFIEESNELIEPLKNGDFAERFDRNLVTDIYNYAYVNGVTEIAEKAAPKIRSNSSLMKSIGNVIYNTITIAGNIIKNLFGSYEELGEGTIDLKKVCEGVLKDTIDNVTRDRTRDWLMEIRDQKRPITQDLYDHIELVQQIIDQKWKVVCANDAQLQDISSEHFEFTLQKISLSDVFKSIQGASVGTDAMDFVSSMLVSGGASLAFSSLFFLSNPAGWLLGLAAIAVGFIMATDEEETIERIQEALKTSILEDFNTEFKEKFITALLGYCVSDSGTHNVGLARIRYTLVEEMLEKFLEDKEVNFRTIYKNCRQISKASNERRRKVSDLCNDIRINSIKPLSDKITKFIEETKPLCQYCVPD